jgi:hypothetical protein
MTEPATASASPVLDALQASGVVAILRAACADRIPAVADTLAALVAAERRDDEHGARIDRIRELGLGDKNHRLRNVLLGLQRGGDTERRDEE